MIHVENHLILLRSQRSCITLWAIKGIYSKLPQQRVFRMPVYGWNSAAVLLFTYNRSRWNHSHSCAKIVLDLK